jgi:hypothetical protein
MHELLTSLNTLKKEEDKDGICATMMWLIAEQRTYAFLKLCTLILAAKWNSLNKIWEKNVLFV